MPEGWPCWLRADRPRTVRRPPCRRASRSMRRSGRCRSGAFLVEPEELLVILFGDLQPDEESGKDRERDDDQCGEGDPQRDRDGLQSLHGSTSLRLMAADGWTVRSVAWWWTPSSSCQCAADSARARPCL